MTDDIRWKGPRPDPAAQAATTGDPEERAATRGAETPSKDGEAPETAKRRATRRNRRRRGRGGGAKGPENSVPPRESAGDGGARASQGGRARASEGATTGYAKAGGARQEAAQKPKETASEDKRPAKRRGGPVFAALDLGTNNCRLLIARGEERSFQIIDSFSRAVRLGEGLGDTGALSEGAIERSVAALSVCADRLAKHRALRLRAIATEACRRATNQRAFLDRVRDETGIALDVVAAEEEARLAVAGCAPLLDPRAEELLVFDIGGGSTELIWVDLSRTSETKRRSLLMALAHGESRSDRARAAARHIRDWISIPLGVVTLGEAFLGRDDEARFRVMHGEVQRRLEDFVIRNGPLSAERLARMQVLGASGTITTLAGVHLDLQRYSRKAVDGLWIDRSDIETLIEDLAVKSAEERRRIPCVGEDRADNLMCGAAILLAILRAWPTQRLRVADRGLREGMLYGLMQDGRARRGGRRRTRYGDKGPNAGKRGGGERSGGEHG